MFFALLPLIVVLTYGAYVVIMGGPFLIGAVGLAGVVVGLTQRGQSVAHRMSVILAGTSLMVAAVTALVAGVGLNTSLARRPGTLVGVLGIVALVLGSGARTLTGRTRVALGVVACGGGVRAGLVRDECFSSSCRPVAS